MGKRGQVTIFIIIGIAIVAIGVLIYLFYPKLQSLVRSDSNNPNAFMQTCLEDEIEDVVEILSLQGGSMNPEHYYLYEDNPIEYLCYTNEYYITCVVQQPMLKSHIESEIKNEISPIVDACFEDLKSSFEDKGYDVILTEGDTTVELLPEKILTTLTHELSLTKGDTENYETFRVLVNNGLYEFIGIARSMIAWEAAYGDVETTTYMNYYHDLKVEKLNQVEGSTIYILTNRDTGGKFQFASRSVAWPPGYGI
ncbi:hypothetical protein KAI04_02620 [Candidatus Pacearchaeota archaeon]|nr:hypothetical protein [Candidatus Pacearchaeota archaeon]